MLIPLHLISSTPFCLTRACGLALLITGVFGLTGCQPSRAAPTHTLAAGWYYVGPVPTPAQRQEALSQMVDGASDHRVEDVTTDTYNWKRPAVVYLESPDVGVLVQREPSRLQMAFGHPKMKILNDYAGVQVIVDGDNVMLGDGTHKFTLDAFSMLDMWNNPAFFGVMTIDGEVTFDNKLDPGNEYWQPKLSSAKVPLQTPIVLISKSNLIAAK